MAGNLMLAGLNGTILFSALKPATIATTMAKTKLYTIGYQQLNQTQLKKIVVGLNAVLADCRSIPKSRKPGFNKHQLEQLLGQRYIHVGHFLGGKGSQVTHNGIQWIKSHIKKGNLILMCMEHDPEFCHRHKTICAKHFPQALHIRDNQLIRASALQKAINRNESSFDLAGYLSVELTRHKLKLRKLV